MPLSTPTPPRPHTRSASTTPSSQSRAPQRVSAAQRRTVTVARGVLLRLDRLAQRREHARVAKVCAIRAAKVWRLARALGIGLPATPLHSREGPRNICHALGSALSSLFTHGRGPAGRKRTYAYPVRVLGAGVAGVAFCMSDGTVIKAVSLRRPAGWGRAAGGAAAAAAAAASAPPTADHRSGGLASSGRPVPLREFLYEVRTTRRAHALFDSSRAGAFRVPRVLRHVILEGQARHGRRGQLVGVVQMSWAPGRTLFEVLRRSPAPLAAALARRHGRALAAVHARGWIHGDMHTGNVICEPPPRPEGPGRASKKPQREAAASASAAAAAAASATAFTVIDWARANTERAVLRLHPGGREAGRALWRRILRYEVAHPYRDYMRTASRALAEAFLAGYLQRSGADRGRGVFGGPAPLLELRVLRQRWNEVMDLNYRAMFRALDIASSALEARRERVRAAPGARSI
jgi:hypothetical protein